MPKPSPNLAQYFLEKGLLSREQYQDILKKSLEEEKSIEAVLSEEKIISEDKLIKAKSEIFNLEGVDLEGRIIPREILEILPQEITQNYEMGVFEKRGREIWVALVDSTNLKAREAIEFIARKENLKIKYFITSLSSFRGLLRQYGGLKREVEEALIFTQGKIPGREVGKEEVAEEVIKAAPVSKMVSVIIRHAVEGRASDIHIEPLAHQSRVRYRVDGILHTSLLLPKYVHSALVTRIKVLANLKIDETRKPQDGRIRLTIGDKEVDFRVSTLPVVGNEKVVMRILEIEKKTPTLEELGFEGRNLEIIKKNLGRSHGLSLVTGPTGSGKSTTLYAILTILNKEGVNIITLEDPIEYYLSGLNQSQINPEIGYTFARGLRSILRQDPNVIMVGEIRDQETAELAIHASLTGHIVLSTLHTNDAFGAIPRLIDMKMEPFLLATAIRVVIAQRLVRRICQACRKKSYLSPNLEAEIEKELETLPKNTFSKNFRVEKPFKIYRGKGCYRCGNTGYSGRIAISEVLEVTENLQKIITEGCSLERVREESSRQGMFSLKQDGILKTLKGITTVEEVIVATRE